MHIAGATSAQWAAVRRIRLRALEDAPGAFGSTLTREEGLTEQEWRDRVKHAQWFLAWQEDRPVGVACGLAWEGRPEERHVVSMWVAPELRGTGLATRLVRAVARWARGEGASYLSLWVADPNRRAQRFYARLGFSPTGDRQPLPSAPEIGEQRMRLSLGEQPPTDPALGGKRAAGDPGR